MSHSPAKIESSPGENAGTEARLGHELVLQGRSFSGLEPDCVFLNTRGLRFADISAVSGLNFPDDGRGIAATDWDLDGDIDFWVAARTGPQVRFARNDISTGNHWLQLRLEGKTCNRDAIGARVEVQVAAAEGAKPLPLIKSLRAGEGYLSQSGKWLHFGLGADTRIEKVVVRWPGRAAEEFRGIEADRRWRLVQGSGAPEPWTAPARKVALGATLLEGTRSRAESRTWFTARIPIPIVPYEKADGTPALVQGPGENLLLLNLWGSWCKACNTELQEFTKRAGDLRAAGVEVLALNIESIQADSKNDPQRARRLLEEWGVPFECGSAKPEMIDRLEVLTSQLFGRRRPLSLPTSLLLDRQRRVVALYRGPVDVDVLLEDARHEADPAERWIERSLPFVGKWNRLQMRNPVKYIADQYYWEGDLTQAYWYYSQALALAPDDPKVLLSIGAVLSAQGKPDEARVHLERCVAIDPKNPRYYEYLGLVCQLKRQEKEAEGYFLKQLELEPNEPEAHFNLAGLMAAFGRWQRAESSYQEAIRLKPDHVEAHNALGMVYAGSGRLALALECYLQAAKLAPKSPDPHYNAGVALARMGRGEEALTEFTRTVELDPKYPRAQEAIDLLRQQLRR